MHQRRPYWVATRQPQFHKWHYHRFDGSRVTVGQALLYNQHGFCGSSGFIALQPNFTAWPRRRARRQFENGGIVGSAS